MRLRIFTALLLPVLLCHGSPVFAGPVGKEFRANQITLNAQSGPDSATLTDGTVVAVWTTVAKDGATTDVKGRCYDRDGKPLGPEFFINTFRGGNQDDPAVAALEDGGFVVTWASLNQDGSGWGIYARRFDPDCNAGNPVRINITAEDNQLFPDVAGLSNGGFAITWTSFNQFGIGADVIVRVFDADSRPVGRERRVNSRTRGDQTQPQITAHEDGFAIAFTSFSEDGNDSEVMARFFNNNARPFGREFQANTETDSFQVLPAITTLPNNRIAIAWQSLGQDGDLGGIFGQIFNPHGNRVGREFQLNIHTDNWQENVALAPTQNGFVAAWNSWEQDASGIGIFGRVFDESGQPTKPKDFRINTFQAGDQIVPSIAGSPNGSRVIFFWTSANGQPDTDLYGQPWNMGP
jgi:hypothetical protein